MRVLEKYRNKMIILEFKGPNYKNVYQFKKWIFDLDYFANEINKSYRRLKTQKAKIKSLVNYFYKNIALGKKVLQNVAFNKNQKTNLLPSGFKKNSQNISIFVSSEFEYAALGSVYDEKIYKNQIDALSKICKSLSKSKKKIFLWVRLHPNLQDVRWSYIYDFYNLEKKYKFLSVISASSKISSYALMHNSKKIICFNSRMGIEAVYAKKPSILLNRNPYEKFKSNYLPKNHDDMMKLLFSNLKPKSTLGSDKFALWSLAGGKSLAGFQGSYEKGFSFHNNKTKRNLYYSILYYLGRIIDRYYFFYFRNIGIKILLKTFFLRK